MLAGGLARKQPWEASAKRFSTRQAATGPPRLRLSFVAPKTAKKSVPRHKRLCVTRLTLLR
jgi:hypothetical protein